MAVTVSGGGVRDDGLRHRMRHVFVAHSALPRFIVLASVMCSCRFGKQAEDKLVTGRKSVRPFSSRVSCEFLVIYKELVAGNRTLPSGVTKRNVGHADFCFSNVCPFSLFEVSSQSLRLLSRFGQQ